MADSSATNVYTLGDLLRDLKAAKAACNRERRKAERLERDRGPIRAHNSYVQAGLYRWNPEPERMPGIHRIELICNELYATGITVDAILKLRSVVCRADNIDIPRADELSLNAVADIVERRSKTATATESGAGGKTGPKPAAAPEAESPTEAKPTVRVGDMTPAEFVVAVKAADDKTETASPSKKARMRRGRKKADYETVRREAQIVDDWKQAKENKRYKPDFAKEKGMTLKELDRLLNRVARRKARSE